MVIINGFTLLVLITGFFAGRGYQKLMAYGEHNEQQRRTNEINRDSRRNRKSTIEPRR
jgi:hypothetical protein